ncbi:uncharacterized protein BDZ99DRAFT_555467 [Mytilinidion resinicola]|uniref:Uncharacterized protein n=1 Tax=Mytilinidion resinicola TaxID=574789 RepID=A0A6A6XXS0_9PEZI|nr:uncharacterized protein BDZ99DRAFT_555467 [Mytilinidion resinicola]KAF2801282.1 hypothetical protein BDZ99DRAFT_555467 [Mytilinidion resinicola]
MLRFACEVGHSLGWAARLWSTLQDFVHLSLVAYIDDADGGTSRYEKMGRCKRDR